MDQTYSLNGACKPATKRFADLDGPDFYPTPAWATHALIDNEHFVGTSGSPPAAMVLARTGNTVISSDLYDRGYGEAGHDFLSTDRTCDNVTNPPFHSAEGFVARALQQARGKVALLLRLAFLEGANRCLTIYRPHPPSRVWVFSERITFYPKGAQRAGSGITAYAWFVWDRSHAGPTEINWLEPGYKAKYGGSYPS